MEDDIDDLLNEVENRFCTNNARPDPPSRKPASVKTKNRGSASDNHAKSKTDTDGDTIKIKKTSRCELDSMIDDIFDDSAPDQTIPAPSNNRSSSPRSSTVALGSKKCFIVYLGGSKYPIGIATTVQHRACNALRCTACDFNVEMFDDVIWDSKTDYLFLRNNVPNFEKLKVNFIRKKGWRAYACQCTSKSVFELLELQGPEVKWVCGKH